MRIACVFLILTFSFLISSCSVFKDYFSVGHGVAAGESMSPTIKSGDHFGYAWLKLDEEFLERFDIIVFKVDSNIDKQIKEDTTFVFRVIGLESEKVEIKKGKIFINNKFVEEPFQKVESPNDFAAIVVPKGEYFVLGDNRPNSFDSRLWSNKTIKRANVLGVVSNIIRKEDYDKGKRW